MLQKDKSCNKYELYAQKVSTLCDLSTVVTSMCQKNTKLLNSFCHTIACLDGSRVLCSTEFAQDGPLVRLSKEEFTSHPFSSRCALVLTKNTTDHDKVLLELLGRNVKAGNRKTLVVVDTLEARFSHFPSGPKLWKQFVAEGAEGFIIFLQRNELVKQNIVHGFVDEIIVCQAQTVNPASKYCYLLFSSDNCISRTSVIGLFVESIHGFRKISGISALVAKRPELKQFSFAPFFQKHLVQLTTLPANEDELIVAQNTQRTKKQLSPSSEESFSQLDDETRPVSSIAITISSDALLSQSIAPTTVVETPWELESSKNPQKTKKVIQTLQNIFGDYRENPITVTNTIVFDYSLHQPDTLPQSFDRSWYQKHILS